MDQVVSVFYAGFHISLDCTRQSQMLNTSNKQLLQNIMLLGNKIDKNYTKAINEYNYVHPIVKKSTHDSDRCQSYIVQ